MKLLASDGLLARPSQIWTREKLRYLEKYAQAFMTAMAPKRAQGKWDRLEYIDLLCGPGLSVVRETNEEFYGSPLIALRIKPAFDHLYFADLNPENISALKKRVLAQDADRVTFNAADCNIVVDEVLKRISNRTLGLAFIDPEGFEVDFETLAKLAKKRIDLLYLFASGIGVRRNLKNALRATNHPLDKWWGGKDWRELPVARWAAGRSSEEPVEKVLRSFVSAFRKKVGSAGFQFQDEEVLPFSNTKNAPMYHLLYFSHDRAGLTIWKNIKKIAPGGQRSLL
ncbi:MAG: three-Cys-motif partner protein TcmP [Candidatus Binatus sp.]